MKKEINYLTTMIIEGPQVKNLKILIAEDDQLSALLLRKAVSQYGKEISEVKTGVEAVDYCRINPDLDLIMMDIQMPEMDGYKATKEIRKFNSKVLIIAQTAFALSGDKNKALNAGCNAYITKPLNRADLDVIIKKLFFK